MSNKKYETVLFDFDDTIVDLDGYWNRYVTEFANKHNLKVDNVDEFKKKINHNETDLEPTLIEEFKSENRRRQPVEIELLPNVQNTLETLKQNGLVLGIVTNAGKGRVSAILEAKGMTSMFSVVVGMEDVVNTKPHAEPVEKALSLLGKPKETALLVGDAYAEVWAGKNAGVDTALIETEKTEIPIVNGHPTTDKPTYTIKDFGELLTFL